MQLGGTGFGQCHSFFMARQIDRIEPQGLIPTYFWYFLMRPARPARGAADGRKHLFFWCQTTSII